MNYVSKDVIRAVSNDKIDVNELNMLSYKNNVCIEIIDNKEEKTTYTSVANNNCFLMDSKVVNKAKNKFIKSELEKITFTSYNYIYNDELLIYGKKLGNRVIFISTPLNIMNSILSVIQKEFIYGTFFVLIISLALAYFLSKKFSNPIMKMTKESKKMVNGDYDVKFKESNSTREIVGELVNVLVKNIPTLMVGSADVSSSTKIGANTMVPFNSSNYSGQRISYGVREFAMASIVNGMTAHGGIKAIGSTFLSFFDYNKAAIRLAAIGQIPSINVYSHDSITVGEDGPTHQPVEQIASLRLIPNHYLFRPCNLYESLYALKFALDSKTAPVTIVTSRSAFKQYQTKSYEDVSKGAYVISNTPNKSYRLTLIATGSEVETAIRVQELLARKRISARVISAPCLELFDKQNPNYIRETLGNKPIISIEYGVTASWYKYADLAK